MIIISRHDEESYLVINKFLLQKYKSQCDIYLVNVRRELTRCLVDYRVFQKLQQINNNFFKIINGLEKETYSNLKELSDDKKQLQSSITTFIKYCENVVSSSIYTTIQKDCKDLTITIQKLLEIVKVANRKDIQPYVNI